MVLTKCKNNVFRNEAGYSLTEIMIAVAIIGVIAVAAMFALFQYRNGVEYDILLNKITESVHYAKLKATTSRLDDEDNRISYSVIFLENEIVDFEGTTYDENAETNVLYSVPIGFRLTSVCSPTNNGIVTFSPIVGETSNTCTINIYKAEQASPTGTIVVGRYGVEAAS